MKKKWEDVSQFLAETVEEMRVLAVWAHGDDD
jgi:hypothetical protein